MYSTRLYPAAKNLISKIALEDKNELDITEEISIISASKLIDGGAAILQAENINHQNVMAGKINSIPLVINNLRVLNVS